MIAGHRVPCRSRALGWTATSSGASLVQAGIGSPRDTLWPLLLAHWSISDALEADSNRVARRHLAQLCEKGVRLNTVSRLSGCRMEDLDFERGHRVLKILASVASR